MQDDVQYVADRTYFRLSWLPSTWFGWIGWYRDEEQRQGAMSPSTSYSRSHTSTSSTTASR